MTTDNQEREESSHEFDAFRSALNRELAPQNSIEQLLSEQIPTQLWRLRRILLAAELNQRTEN